MQMIIQLTTWERKKSFDIMFAKRLRKQLCWQQKGGGNMPYMAEKKAWACLSQFNTSTEVELWSLVHIKCKVRSPLWESFPLCTRKVAWKTAEFCLKLIYPR